MFPYPENFIQIVELLLGDIICDSVLQCYADSQKKVIMFRKIVLKFYDFIFYQEQQLYYKEITEACVGSDEPRRSVSHS